MERFRGDSAGAWIWRAKSFWWSGDSKIVAASALAPGASGKALGSLGMEAKR
jgi:hypothetical protein